VLRTNVLEQYNRISMANCQEIAQSASRAESSDAYQRRQLDQRAASHRDIRKQIYDEASIAGVLLILAQEQRVKELNSISSTCPAWIQRRHSSMR
jgi:hypothetical protein